MHCDLQIDAVEQRSREGTLVALDGARAAAASSAGIPQIAAGAGIGGGHQLEPGRIGNSPGGPDERYAAIFQGLAQRLQGGGRELGQLVQKQDSMVRVSA